MGVLTLCRLHGLSTGQETGTRFRKRHTLIMHAYTRLSCLDASEVKVRPRRRRRLMRSGWVICGIIVKCTSCIMCVCLCERAAMQVGGFRRIIVQGRTGEPS